MKNGIIFLIIGLVCQIRLNGQASFGELENNKIIYPSPTASSLGKYGEYPVSLYNGLVNIGQDIVTVKSGRLSLNVSLSYHASGNKPSDIPGWVGLGFSLNAGGVITRVIKDLPDDFAGGFYHSNTSVQNLWNNNITHFFEDYNNGAIDPRSDVYQFNFCGRAGEFVFDWDRNIHFKQQVPIQIQELYGPGGFSGFKIFTEDGTIYTFDQIERSNFNFSTLDQPASSWYLTKISNLSGDNIVLKYSTPMSKFRYKQYSTRKEVAGTISSPGLDLVTGPTINVSSSMDEVIYLEEIEFNNGKLLFGTSTRTDPYFVPSGITTSTSEEKKLDLITLLDYNNKVVKKWKFEYFENDTERLKLKNLVVQARDESDVQKYSFSYNSLKLPLPGPGPTPQNPYFSNSVDYWGYYNAEANGENRIPKMYMPEFNQFVGSAKRSINPLFVKAEILEKITYPTGGYALFDFESNDYSAQGASFAADQNPMTQSSTPPEFYELNYDRDGGGFDTDPATLSFTLTESTHVHLSFSIKSDGDLKDWAPLGEHQQYDLYLPAGSHNLRGLFQTDQLLLEANSNITEAHCYATVYKMGPLVPIYAKTGPGLRIKSIATNDGITTTTRSFEYKLDDPQNPSISSGFLSVFPSFYAPLSSIAANMQGYLATSDPINDVGEGAPVGYSRVVERFQDNSSIVHFYTTYDDYPDETMPFLNGFSDPKLAHMSSNNFQRGMETKIVYYNTNGAIQKEINNSYTVLQESVADVQAIELKPTVQVAPTPGSTAIDINAPLASVYYVHSCFLYNSSSVETIFDENGQNPITNTINKYYDNVKHLQPTRIETTSSDGSILTTATSFPDDFEPGEPFINYMQANHLKSFPIEQIVYKQKGGVNNIISGNIITYKTEGAGLPEQLFKLETTKSLSQTSFKFSNRLIGVLPPSSEPSQYSTDTRYQPTLSFTQYDNKGNLLESLARNGIKTSYLWGYKQEFPVAQIVGADYSTAFSKVSNPAVLDDPLSDEDLRSELTSLRTIPGALVTTYTYAPSIGVTSQTDPNSRTTYYEYDPFNRLSFVRDQDHNLLKGICYNYAGQPEQCIFYKSDAIIGNYYSQNCSSDESPVAYHVSVPQGMFMSYVDQQAANELAQQHAQMQANKHGNCQIVNVSVYGENNHGTSINIQLHNVGTGQDYWFTADPHSSGTLGDAPPGTYDITVTPSSSSGWYNYSVGCGYWSDGPGAITFYGVIVNSGCNSVVID